MRVVIIGAGTIAYRHAEGCRDLEGAELVAVCDVSRAAADALADRFGVSGRYTDLGLLLANEEAELAVVATWGSFHAEVVERVARSGRVGAILCEKPLAMDARQAEAMFKVAAESGVLLAEAFRLRNQPIHHRAIDIIRSGRIGEVMHVRNAMMWHMPPEAKDPSRNWRFNQAVGGGVTYDIGCYCINQIRWAMGEEPETVFAAGRWVRQEWTSTWQRSRHFLVGGPPSGACPGRPDLLTPLKCSGRPAPCGLRMPGATTPRTWRRRRSWRSSTVNGIAKSRSSRQPTNSGSNYSTCKTASRTGPRTVSYLRTASPRCALSMPCTSH